MRPDGGDEARRRPGGGHVTMKDVAAHAGVSRATVSLVARDSPQIPLETKQRVHESMKQLGYVYDHRAAAMRTERTMTMGLVATDVRNPYFAELTMALETRLQEAGFALILGYSHDDRDREARLLEVMVQRRVDGVFVIPSKTTTSGDLERWLFVSGTPHVLIARRVHDYDADYVGVDNVRAAVLLGDHLAAEGCRSVAFVGGPATSSARADRERGLSESLKAHGIVLDQRLSVASSADRAGGIDAARHLLEMDLMPDGIACYNDVVAFGVMETLRRAGTIPGADVALASFDDLHEAGYTDPALTSVATYPERVGAEAARLLIERLDTPDAASERILLSPRLSVRASTTMLGQRAANSLIERA